MKRLIQFGVRGITAFDWPLFTFLILLALLGLTVMHSAVGDTDWRFADQLRNFVFAFFVMWIAALVPPPILMRLAPWVYGAGVVLLLGVEFFGETSKGATRWLDIGITRIQPSEMMKLAVPLMLAWYFHKKQSRLRFIVLLVAEVLLAVTFALIDIQPY